MQLVSVPDLTDDPEWIELDAETYVFWLQNSLLEHVTPNHSDCNYEPRFQIIRLPDISIKDYVERVASYVYFIHSIDSHATISPFITSQILMSRFFKITQQKMLPMDLDAIHKLFAVAFYLSIKITLDYGISSTSLTYLFGLYENELSRLETCFLSLLKFELAITKETFAEAADSYFVAKRITSFGQRRHWLWQGARTAFSHVTVNQSDSSLSDIDLSSDEEVQTVERMSIVPVSPADVRYG